MILFQAKMKISPVLFLLILLIGCTSHAIMPEGTEVEMERTSFSFSQNQQPYDLFPDYHIAPGDELDVLFQIRTWLKREEFRIAVDHTVRVKFAHAPELDETQKVRPDGTITLPYIGHFFVVGKTADELKKELIDRYRDILQIPEIAVSVPEFRESIKELKADLHTAPRGLSRLVTVRPDGYVTFPMVGDVQVAGKTIPDVNQYLNKKYEEILPGLHCDLFLERQTGSLVYITGQIKKPGAFKILRPITILEALALGEGHLPGAQLNSVFVVRKHEKKLVATRVNLSDSLALNDESKFFYLMPNDIVYVPKTWLSNAADVMRDLSNVLLFRGWSIGMNYDLHTEGTSPQRTTTTPTEIAP